MNENSRPQDFAENTRFYGALSGLTSALETLHDYKPGLRGTEMIGYHHDLRPKNVLVSKARFILSDFGLSKLKTGEDSRTLFKRGQGHYLAPECEDLDNNFAKGVISRASDVWSLGCIILEVIVFMVKGADAIVGFRERLTTKRGSLTSKTLFRGDSIHPEVVRIMLEFDECDDPAIKDTAALVRQILVIDHKKRPKASEIALRLRIISFKASYLRLHVAFQSIRWRIESPDTITEWDTFHHAAHMSAFEDNSIASNDLDIEILHPFASRADFEGLLASMESLHNCIVCSDLSSDVSARILPDLRQLNISLKVQNNDEQRQQDPESGATPLEIDSDRNTPGPVASTNVRNLTLKDCILTVPTSTERDIVISEDERFLAMEQDRQLTIYALPLGERIQSIENPDELQPFRAPGECRHPNFRFSPDGKNLIVCWVRHVSSYRVGRDEESSWTVFTLPTPEWNTGWKGRPEPLMVAAPIECVAISADSKKAALNVFTRANTISDARDNNLVYIVRLTENEAANMPPIPTTVTYHDCLFGFSPDGRQLAVTSHRTVEDNKRPAIHIRMLDVGQTRTNRLPRDWLKLYCDEKFNEGPRNVLRSDLQKLFLLTKQPRLMFAVWNGRWIVGLWKKTKQALVLHDLHSKDLLASIHLSCLDAFNPAMKKTMFSGNIEMVAGWRGPSNTISNKLKGGKKKTSEASVVCANIKTNQPIYTLKDVAVDQCWLSRSGQYIAVRSKKELKVFATVIINST